MSHSHQWKEVFIYYLFPLSFLNFLFFDFKSIKGIKRCHYVNISLLNREGGLYLSMELKICYIVILPVLTLNIKHQLFHTSYEVASGSKEKHCAMIIMYVQVLTLLATDYVSWERGSNVFISSTEITKYV